MISMSAEIITKEDLEEFEKRIIAKIDSLLENKNGTTDQNLVLSRWVRPPGLEPY